ncbi:glyoxalase [Bacillus pseudomycoides]|uniref:glyoxalase n=1 Tax=Bacillus pseudomycoides TaxID=64104 RepID=UPI000BFBFAE8|nr:glyoxalase [Bacillus pseudomycoides]PHG24720.1 glyoxalase [Bacillus pseudomycoides]
MKEAIEEFIKGLRESAIDSRKDADQAFENGDLGLAGFHRGQWLTLEDTATVLEDILSDYKEEEQ